MSAILGNIIAFLAVAAFVGAALRTIIRNAKGGGCGCGGCTGGPGCPHCASKEKES